MTVSIASGGYFAAIDLAHGANCISLRNEKYKAKLLREPVSDVPDNPFLYGMPILFPANRISGGEFCFEGRRYLFPINESATGCMLHGELHRMAFELVEHRDDLLRASFSSEYLGFPHKFSIEIIYKISEDGLWQRVVVKNMSDENMPCLLGFHTTFNIPFAAEQMAEDIKLFAECDCEIERNSNYLPTGRIVMGNDFLTRTNLGELPPHEYAFSKHCTACGDGRIELRDEKNHVCLVYENDKKYPFRLFYNGSADEYVCLEPMNCAVDPFNAGYKQGDLPPLWRAIPPHGCEEYISKIYLKKI